MEPCLKIPMKSLGKMGELLTLIPFGPPGPWGPSLPWEKEETNKQESINDEPDHLWLHTVSSIKDQ